MTDRQKVNQILIEIKIRKGYEPFSGLCKSILEIVSHGNFDLN